MEGAESHYSEDASEYPAHWHTRGWKNPTKLRLAAKSGLKYIIWVI